MTPTVNSASVIDLRAYADPSVVPTLVLVDLQKEYIAAPRILALPHAPQALANCRIALTHARTKGFPVAFVRWLGRSALFNRATPFSGWIEGFEPTGADMVFERDRPSCYSSLSFGEVMSDSGSSFVLAGFAGESACLATAIDAFHRGHRITYRLAQYGETGSANEDPFKLRFGIAGPARRPGERIYFASGGPRQQ